MFFADVGTVLVAYLVGQALVAIFERKERDKGDV
jgi:hypothetical protein